MDMEGSQKAAQCCALADNHHSILETYLENAFFQVFFSLLIVQGLTTQFLCEMKLCTCIIYLTLGNTNWNNRIYLLIRSHVEGQATRTRLNIFGIVVLQKYCFR